MRFTYSEEKKLRLLSASRLIMEEFYRKNYKKFLAMAKRSIRSVDDAQDVTADAFVKAMRYYDPEKVKNINSWFFNIMRSAIADYHRERIEYRKWTFNAGAVSRESDPLSNIEDNLCSKDQLSRVVDILKNTDKGLAYDMIVEGLSRKELSAKYGLCEKTISRRSVSYKKLITKIGESYGIQATP